MGRDIPVFNKPPHPPLDPPALLRRVNESQKSHNKYPYLVSILSHTVISHENETNKGSNPV